MKALVCRALSDDFGQLAFEDTALPALAPDDVRIRIRAAGVNFPDLLMVQGKYQHRPELPFIVGGERAGEIIATGSNVQDFRIGDRVIGGGLTGGFAEECQLPAAAVRAVPDDADFATAAAFTTAYLTAYVALVCQGELQAGETLLVHGAAGGVGLAAVDLGRVLGANVIATASTDDKRAFLKNYGPDHVLPASGFREPLKMLTGGRGADVIYDPVGGDVFDESTRCIAFNGRLLVVGFASGRIPSIAANIPLIKGFSVMGVRAGEYGRRFPDEGRANIAAIDGLLAEGKIRPHIGARFPLSRAVEAMRMLAERRIIGKAIVEP
jgi:NADPH2:quinone reductase